MKRHVIPALSLYFCMFSLAAEQTSVLQGATIIDGKGGVFDNGVVVVQGDANGHEALPSLDWIRSAFDASDN